MFVFVVYMHVTRMRDQDVDQDVNKHAALNKKTHGPKAHILISRMLYQVSRMSAPEKHLTSWPVHGPRWPCFEFREVESRSCAYVAGWGAERTRFWTLFLALQSVTVLRTFLRVTFHGAISGGDGHLAVFCGYPWAAAIPILRVSS